MIKKKKVLTHPAIKGSINASQDQGVESPAVKAINRKLYLLEGKRNTPCLLDPVKAYLSGGSSLFMERIIGTTHFLSNNRKIIYDVCFADLYLHNGKIPENHMVVENMLLRVEDWCHIEEEEKFLMILSKETAPSVGMQFFIDDKLYISNVPFSKSESMRNELLRSRNDGNREFFKVLKIKNSAGNITEFHTHMTEEKTKARKALHLAVSKHSAVVKGK